jgi:hypothetical protein
MAFLATFEMGSRIPFPALYPSYDAKYERLALNYDCLAGVS